MNILMAAMQLNIGGAETHILDLCRELILRGHRITLVSAGGMLEEQAAKDGVRCVYAPLCSSDPIVMAKASRILSSLVKKEPFDLIHAHARIPAFLCGRIARLAGIPMVTTAHGVYRVDGLLRRLSDWGESTLAVSCHVKEYLMKEYALPEESIGLTVNGIDTARFFPRRESEGVKPCRLIHVSRLDPGSDACARALLRIAPELHKALGELTVTIVGDGKTARELREAAKDLPFVSFLGARTDIPRLLRRADVFVGVSRAALEAMACGLPTVLCGAQGQLGLYRPEMETAALRTNFCCMNGRGESADAELLESLVQAFTLPDAERTRMAQINRETVVRSFSIARMADDAEALYARVLPGKSARVQIVVGGYYGYGNCGDETLLSEMIRALRAEIPGAAITVLSADPKGTRLRCGTRAIYRYDPAVITELKKADLYLCGGGSLLTDRPSQRSLRYYVGMMALAKKLGCRVMLYAAGVGPFDSAKGSELAAKALRSADAITLRDAASCALAKEIAPGISPILTDDPAMALEPMSGFEAEFLLDRLKLSRGECFALAPRSIPNGTEDWERTLAQTIDAIRTETGKTPLFLVMQEDRDRALCNRIAQICGGRVLPKLSGREAMAVLSACAFSLPMRLHAAILSLKAGTKLHCISYDPKTDAFCKEHAIPFTRAEQIGRLAEDAKRGDLSFSLGDCFGKEAGRSNPAAAAAALLKEAGAK